MCDGYEPYRTVAATYGLDHHIALKQKRTAQSEEWTSGPGNRLHSQALSREDQCRHLQADERYRQVDRPPS